MFFKERDAFSIFKRTLNNKTFKKTVLKEKLGTGVERNNIFKREVRFDLQDPSRIKF